MPAIFATGAECVKWSADFGLSVTSRLLDSHEISACWEKCPSVDQSGCEHSRLQEAHFPDNCQCFDEKTITSTLVSTPTFPEFPWILRGVDC